MGEEPMTPCVCPLCGGRRLVPNGFYFGCGPHWTTSSATPEMCRSCDGTGIVWSRHVVNTRPTGGREEEG